jgi:hypothetical protein
MRNTIKLLFIAALMSTPAFAANLFVPNQHPTIQAAVDVASPGDRILVAAGEYEGAVINKWVKISGEGDQTVIIHGPNNQGGCCLWFQNGFRIEAGADKTSIRDLTVDLLPLEVLPEFELVQNGIFGVGVDKVEISNVKFIGLNGGVEFRSGDKWHVTKNTVEGLHATQARQATAFRLIDTSDSFIGFNSITHDESLDGSLGKIFRGISLECFACIEPSENNKLLQNEVAINAPGARFINDIQLIDNSARYGGPVLLFNNKIIQNNVGSMRFVPLLLTEYNVIE